MLNALRSFKQSSSPILSALLSFTYAITDEIHQLFIPGRAFQLVDLAVDLAGIILGTVAFIILVKIIKSKKDKSLCT